MISWGYIVDKMLVNIQGIEHNLCQIIIYYVSNHYYYHYYFIIIIIIKTVVLNMTSICGFMNY